MSESLPDVDMTFSVWSHQCERPWPGDFVCRDLHLAGPVSCLAANMFVDSFRGFNYPAARLEIRHQGRRVWDNDVIPPCNTQQKREQPDV